MAVAGGQAVTRRETLRGWARDTLGLCAFGVAGLLLVVYGADVLIWLAGWARG